MTSPWQSLPPPSLTKIDRAIQTSDEIVSVIRSNGYDPFADQNDFVTVIHIFIVLLTGMIKVQSRDNPELIKEGINILCEAFQRYAE